MSERIFTLASLSEMARRTTETPPRVSVYDVIAAAKGCDGNVAGEVFRRMLHSGTVPTCEEVPQSLIQANCLNQTSRGGVTGCPALRPVSSNTRTLVPSKPKSSNPNALPAQILEP